MDKTEIQQEVLFAQRYRILRLIGEGGMGKVYLVEDTLLGTEQVALKVLHPDLTLQDRHTQRFFREVQLTRQVTHPNVVRTYEVGECSEGIFFTMEYFAGVSVKERIRDSGPLEVSEAIRVLIEVCQGLDAIHKAGIIHRDLKTGNVLLGPDGSVKITDFGVARPPVSDLTSHDEVVGSVNYISPEIWSGAQIGPQSDIYALGVFCYNLLLGIDPFSADAPAEMMCKHLQVRPVPPVEIAPELPAWVSELVVEMLAKEPHARPQSGRDVVARIVNFTGSDQGSGIRGYQPGVKAQADSFDATPPGHESFSDPNALEHNPMLLIGGAEGELTEDEIDGEWHPLGERPVRVEEVIHRWERDEEEMVAPKPEHEELSHFALIQELLKSLFRFVGGAVVAAGVGALVLLVVLPMIRQLGVYSFRVDNDSLSVMVALFSALMFVAVLALPGFAVAKARATWRTALRGYAIQAVYVAISFAALWTVLLFQVKSGTPALRQLGSLGEVFRALRATWLHYSEVLLLRPFAPQIDTSTRGLLKPLAPGEIVSFADSGLYYIVLTGFVVALAFVAGALTHRLEKAHILTVVLGAVLMMVGLVLAENLGWVFLSGYLSEELLINQRLVLGPLRLEGSLIHFTFSALNWVGLFFCLVIVPQLAEFQQQRSHGRVVFRPRRKRRGTHFR